MNGIEKITERIAAQADTDAKALTAKAQAQAKAIYDGYQAAADQDYQNTLKKGEKDAKERVERLGSVAQLEARKLQLKTKQELLEETFQKAYEKLLALPEDQYAALLTRLAVSSVTTGSEALVFSQTDRSRYGKRVVIAANEQLEKAGKPGRLTLSEEARPFQGGLYVQDGSVEVNCTFAALLRVQREHTAKDVAAILFD